MELSRKEEYRNQKFSIAVTLLSFVVMLAFFIFTRVGTSQSSSTPLALTEVMLNLDNGNYTLADAPKELASVSASKKDNSQTNIQAAGTDLVLKNSVNNLTELFRNATFKTANTQKSESDAFVPAFTGEPEGNTTNGFVTSSPSMGYDLARRNLVLKPKFTADTKEEGTVVVEITVDKTGTVIEAVPNGRGTTTSSTHLKNEARKMALATKFSENQKIDEQRGTITINFSFD